MAEDDGGTTADHHARIVRHGAKLCPYLESSLRQLQRQNISNRPRHCAGIVDSVGVAAIYGIAMSSRHPSPLSDTGERERIADAVAERLGESVTMDQVEIAVIEGCENWHEKHCPSKDLKSDLQTLVKEFTSFRAEIHGQMRMIFWGVPILLTLGGMLVAAVWKISESAQVHRHATIQDAGLPAGTAVAYSSNK